MLKALKLNFKVYLMEAICLGLFMVSASFFGTLLEYPGSPVHQMVTSNFLRLCLMGLAMGATAALLTYSPMGKLSGAHMNPAISFTFVQLKKMKTVDALYYTLFQCVGGILAVTIMTLVLGDAFKDLPVNYAITAPGNSGSALAFIAEVTIAFFMMVMVLITTNHTRLSKYTGVIAGFFVMSYVILTGPVSGFGMNPARTMASAVPAMQFPSFWIYMTAPFIGMFSAAALYKRFVGAVICAKMHHSEFYKCIFDCDYCKHQSLVSSPEPLRACRQDD
jgi:aquaporin Z